MARNRKKAEAIVLKWMQEIDPSGKNNIALKQQWHDMTDKQFDTWLEECRAKRNYVPITDPNFGDQGITTENNLAVGTKMGIEWFNRLWMVDQTTGQRFLTKERFLCLWTVARRQRQTLADGFTVSDDNNSVDDLTNQAVGDSKGSGVTAPEILILAASELNNTILECIKIRGGDEDAMRLTDASIIETGHATISAAKALGTRAKVVDSTRTFLYGMHYRNTF